MAWNKTGNIRGPAGPVFAPGSVVISQNVLSLSLGNGATRDYTFTVPAGVGAGFKATPFLCGGLVGSATVVNKTVTSTTVVVTVTATALLTLATGTVHVQLMWPATS